ncbi:MAG: 23S rRNA (cytosine1962-C5)-methyltransferase [Planctomycetota bacterium]|jgi:23S rRNA (cytosine1962-C5)-methyltransferase
MGSPGEVPNLAATLPSGFASREPNRYCPRPMARSVSYPVIKLLGDDVHRGPWVYSRQVETPSWDAPPDGSLVEVHDRSERFLGHALWNGSSDIQLRWLSRGRRSDMDRPKDFLAARLRDADYVRRKVLKLPARTEAYRISHAEGDDLPGLVVDRMGPVLVCEHHSLGFWNLRQEVETALKEIYPEHAVIHRVPRSARGPEGFEPKEGEEASHPEIDLLEEDIHYLVSPGEGHKTGWFCDQRDNRVRIGALCQGRRVLDLCCNMGGFGLQAARQGARSVLGIDLDEVVLERAKRTAQHNKLDVSFEHADAFDVMRSFAGGPEDRRPDVLVLDPHKIIRGRANLDEGLKKYSDLNTLALEAVRPGGLVATFSCSGALELGAFLGMTFAAARRAERDIRLLATLEASPDHPQRPDWPRSRYLKGALLGTDRIRGARRS